MIKIITEVITLKNAKYQCRAISVKKWTEAKTP